MVCARPDWFDLASQIDARLEVRSGIFSLTANESACGDAQVR
jgi:hypothetical protein